MAFVIVTADEIEIMSGENADATGDTTTYQEALELMAISRVCGWARYNIADNYSSLNTDVKKVVSEYLARFISVQVIAYNMAGYTSRIEAEDMLNIHLHEMEKIEEQFLKDQKWWTYAKGA